ncbi:PKD domain-containing protein [Hymenobacter sediminicola]|uniref:PKD domain-containing protein n=1 Tax=Hymenobacter sediminicola TaxID=2761579 RepID=A0A7G7W4G4_9BACT|nr:PKD domain-containing protein [Hymenobacter sediminicola]QNH61257.1 PKD domain-containing protein [Hymenobacter sediminicola]
MRNLYQILIFSVSLLLASACQKSEPESDPDSQPEITAPVAAFTCAGPFTTGDSTRFVNTSLYADTYFWEFGDGSTSTAKSPAHKYQQAGAFRVTLRASSTSSSVISVADLNINITAVPPAGYSCNCKVTSQDWNGGYVAPRVRLPDENIVLGVYGSNGFEFKSVRYIPEPVSNTPDYLYYRSSGCAGSTCGIARFYSATDSIIVNYHSGGIGGGTNVAYRCKKL